MYNIETVLAFHITHNEAISTSVIHEICGACPAQVDR
jgi:hypothetical protein